MIRAVHNPRELDALVSEARGEGVDVADSDELLRRYMVIAWSEPARGVFMLDPQEANRAEVHVLVGREARGREAVQAGREALAQCAARGIKVVGRTPKVRRDALAYVYATGMRRVGETEDDVLTEAS